ncbi:hypothetical protein [Neorhodopirellula pilleata]|uniref:Uncharacterized protein n=1 Tax=Neorhodopirellula pilleata TaxID=2714738 RepID=A0A5C6AU47_9BACT|nr:hypothetical protein [Neorhodopirellula pilleata]TWU03515.1 hypothetical protein Pla100_04420 [Neorhodopirellula pilleata]
MKVDNTVPIYASDNSYASDKSYVGDVHGRTSKTGHFSLIATVSSIPIRLTASRRRSVLRGVVAYGLPLNDFMQVDAEDGLNSKGVAISENCRKQSVFLLQLKDHSRD